MGSSCTGKTSNNHISYNKPRNLNINIQIGVHNSLDLQIPDIKNIQKKEQNQDFQNHHHFYDPNIKNFDQQWIKEDFYKDYPQQNLKDFNYENSIISAITNDNQKIMRNYFDQFNDMSSQISHLIQLKKIAIHGLQTFDEIKIGQSKNFYFLDRFFKEPSLDLSFFLLKNWDEKNYVQILLILHQIAKSLSLIHQAGFSYKILRPSSVIILNGEIKKNNVYLQSPNFVWSQSEDLFLEDFIQCEEDYQKYDSLCVTFLMIILLDPEQNFEQLLKIRSEDDRQTLLSNLENGRKLPQIMLETVRIMYQIDKEKILDCQQLDKSFLNIINKGPQTIFRFDSLGAYLYFHKKKHLVLQYPFLYMMRKNQIHFYNYENNTFNIIKLYRKKRKFIIKQPIAYNPLDDYFYFFSNNHSSKAVRAYFLIYLKEKQIQIKSEVEFFKSLRGIDIQNPQVFCVSQAENRNDIIIFNNKMQRDEKNLDIFYSCYIIQIKDEKANQDIFTELKQGGEDQIYQKENSQQLTNSEVKQLISICEGPNNYYQKESEIFYFYDIHNKYYYYFFIQQRHFYSIFYGAQIFENGIHYSYVDITIPNIDFKEDILRFACGTQEILEDFIKISFKLTQIQWIVEIQHGVFLMFASKNIFILDFNFKCFYSFASLQQLQFYEKNHINDPITFQYIFEIRNQPFEVKFPFRSSFGKNVLFQDGMLHIMGRKEIETVLCSYELISEQATLVLKSCRSLNSGKDLLLTIPFPLKNLILMHQTVFSRDSQPQQIGQYTVISELMEKEDFKIFKVTDKKNIRYLIRQSKIQSLDQYYYSIDLFKLRMKKKYLIQCKECFLSENDKKEIFVNTLEEYPQSTLEDEIQYRKKFKQFFEPKEIAYLLKIVFKAVIQLMLNNISHGNIIPIQVFFLDNGHTKLAGWHLQNRKKWKCDFIDACSLLHSCVMLEVNNSVQYLTIDKLTQNQLSYSRYPGLLEFLSKVLNNYSDGIIHKQNIEELNEEIKKIYYHLQKEKLDINSICTRHNQLFWIGYQNSFIISIHHITQVFSKTVVKTQDGSLYQFSKYNMFTYDGDKTMYIAGAVKEDLLKQIFYQLQFTFVHNSEIKLKPLPEIPSNLLGPTLYYCNNMVYCFGGYEVSRVSAKQLSRQVFVFSIKKQTWKQLQSLPINLVNSSAIQSQRDKDIIYLFGGISDELDLTGKELNFFQYSISKNMWNFKVDMGNRSPFLNSLFSKPLVDVITDDIFISFQKISGQNNGYFFEIFELQRGGIHLKFSYQDEVHHQDIVKEVNNANPALEYHKILQDNLSLMVKKNTIYHLDEKNKELLIFKYLDTYDKVTCQKIPCKIVDNDIIQSKEGLAEEIDHVEN